MRVFGKDKLHRFMKKHPPSRGPLAAWLAEAENARWRRWADIRRAYPSADRVRTRQAGHRVIFNIKGNDYRLVVRVYFNRGMLTIERLGTHAEYVRWTLEGK